MWQASTLLNQVTNRESVSLSFELFDDDTAQLLDLTGYTFVLEVRKPLPGVNGVQGSAYSATYDIGNYDSSSPVITAALASGLTVTGLGTIQWDATVTQMRSLIPAVYDVGFTLTSPDGTQTRQIMRGKLPVLYGGVT